jgi:hypothetical protein
MQSEPSLEEITTEELNELLAILQADLEEREKHETNLENRIVEHEGLQKESEEQEGDEIFSRSDAKNKIIELVMQLREARAKMLSEEDGTDAKG